LADNLGISYSAVAKAWREYGVQPWRAETFKLSTDPELVAKVADIVGCTGSTENAVTKTPNQILKKANRQQTSNTVR
jgi:hypothetical protein